MALLGGLPGMGSAFSGGGPSIAAPGKMGIGKHSGIAQHATNNVGKPGRTENFGITHTSVGHVKAPSASITGGDPGMHSLNRYGKGGGGGLLAPAAGGAAPGGVDPTAHAGAKMIRGGAGTMRTHLREGGLGPGTMGAPGPDLTNYSGQGMDTE